MRTVDTAGDLQLIDASWFFRVGEAQFGVPGLIAIESVGPFVPIKAIGPMLMIHDGYFQPGFGIGHHPHRTNERLFYILRGRVEHDDALNHIRGTMNEGDLGRLTEGIRGMFHQEWNGAEGQVTRAFILVYHPDTEPPIPTAQFAVLRAGDRVRLSEGPGVETLELIGPDSDFRVNLSTLRRYADTSFAAGASLDLSIQPDRGLLLYPLDGRLTVAAEGREPAVLSASGDRFDEGPGSMALAWSGSQGRAVRIAADTEAPARLLRVEFDGQPDDLVIGEDDERP